MAEISEGYVGVSVAGNCPHVDGVEYMVKVLQKHSAGGGGMHILVGVAAADEHGVVEPVKV